MKSDEFLRVLRELARCYQAFESYSARHIRSLGLTPCQFDIVATLGNTDGMTFKQLGEKTLITKGTLTGVVDRLEAKRQVRREASSADGRSQIVKLTARGETLFARVFPEHLDHLKAAFTGYTAAELQEAQSVLRRLGSTFNQARSQ